MHPASTYLGGTVTLSDQFIASVPEDCLIPTKLADIFEGTRTVLAVISEQYIGDAEIDSMVGAYTKNLYSIPKFQDIAAAVGRKWSIPGISPLAVELHEDLRTFAPIGFPDLHGRMVCAAKLARDEGYFREDVQTTIAPRNTKIFPITRKQEADFVPSRELCRLVMVSEALHPGDVDASNMQLSASTDFASKLIKDGVWALLQTLSESLRRRKMESICISDASGLTDEFAEAITCRIPLRFRNLNAFAELLWIELRGACQTGPLGTINWGLSLDHASGALVLQPRDSGNIPRRERKVPPPIGQTRVVKYGAA